MLPAHLNSHVLSVPPFFHIYGFNGVLNYCIHMGSPLVVIPKFTPEAYIKCLVKYRPRGLYLVPSLLLFLATHPSVTKDHLASIVHITVGAAPASVQVIEKFKAKAESDVFIAQGYGMTESSPVTLYSPLVAPNTKVASTGQLYPSTEARIVSLTDGTNLGAMQNGELFLRGPQVMKGYLNNEQATIETLDADGWLHTGDIAYYDSENYFYIVDRTKELIKVKGNQVSAGEICVKFGTLREFQNVD
jgi:4-coumarate--CoA ligase